jgi:flagellin
MALGVLNNISAIYAQNNLANTQASLSKTLQQLSSGSRINSGADDAAGLSLANGLQASSTALSQSAKNASQGVDFLQVADGALSQVTSLLNRAITLATEASNGTLNASQVSAANSEYQKILTETDTINNNTEYNGINTFAKNSAYTVANASDVVTIGSAATDTATVTFGNQSLTFVNNGQSWAGAGQSYELATTDTITNMASQINQTFGANVATVQGNQMVLSGGATIGKTQTAVWTLALAAGSSLTVQDASDVITPGSTGIAYTQSTTADGVMTDFNAGGKWAAGGAGGTLVDLEASITAAEGSGGTTTVTGGTTLAFADTGSGTVGSITILSTATETGTGVTSGTSNAVASYQNATTDLTDSVQISTNAASGTTSLTVGNASDLLKIATGDALTLTGANGSSLDLSGVTNSVFAGGTGVGGNLSQLSAAINSAGLTGVSATVSGNQLKITGGSLSVNTAGAMTEAESANTKSNQSVSIFTSDGTISQSYNNSASDLVQASSSALQLAGTDLTSTAGAQAALVAINHAITSVAAARGTIGANINTLTAVGNVMTTQSTNTLAAMNDVMATDYGQATSDMSKFQILSQTGIAALSQANQAQQLITKLLQ